MMVDCGQCSQSWQNRSPWLFIIATPDKQWAYVRYDWWVHDDWRWLRIVKDEWLILTRCQKHDKPWVQWLLMILNMCLKCGIMVINVRQWVLVSDHDQQGFMTTSHINHHRQLGIANFANTNRRLPIVILDDPWLITTTHHESLYYYQRLTIMDSATHATDVYHMARWLISGGQAEDAQSSGGFSEFRSGSPNRKPLGISVDAGELEAVGDGCNYHVIHRSGCNLWLHMNGFSSWP